MRTFRYQRSGVINKAETPTQLYSRIVTMVTRPVSGSLADTVDRTTQPQWGGTMDASQLPTYVDLVRWDDVRLIRWLSDARADLAGNPAQPELQRLHDAAQVEVANRQRSLPWHR